MVKGIVMCVVSALIEFHCFRIHLDAVTMLKLSQGSGLVSHVPRTSMVILLVLGAVILGIMDLLRAEGLLGCTGNGRSGGQIAEQMEAGGVFIRNDGGNGAVIYVRLGTASW